MGWFTDLIDITDNVLSTVTTPVKETMEEIVDDIKR